MIAILKKYSVILLLTLIAFEWIEQFSVTKPESWSERRHILLIFLLLGALVWAVRPAFPNLRRFRIPGQIGLIVILTVFSWAAVFHYSWQVRPNLGLYEEPHWVAKHPEFQKQQRARIEQARWR